MTVEEHSPAFVEALKKERQRMMRESLAIERIVQPEDGESLVDAVQRLYDDHERALAAVQRGRAVVRKADQLETGGWEW